MMKVSTIIPTLNEGKYILPCLKQLRKISGNTHEIIVSDAGSTDDTIKIARKYADAVVIMKKRGVAVGRNYGAKFAKNEILAFTDGDTVVDDQWIKQIQKSFENRYVVGAAGKVVALSNKFKEKLYYSIVFNKALVLSHYIGKKIFVGSNCAVLRSNFNRINGFRTDFHSGDDHDLGVRLSKTGKVIYNPKMIVYTSPRKEMAMGIWKMAYKHTRNYVKRYIFGERSYPSEYFEIR